MAAAGARETRLLHRDDVGRRIHIKIGPPMVATASGQKALSLVVSQVVQARPWNWRTRSSSCSLPDANSSRTLSSSAEIVTPCRISPVRIAETPCFLLSGLQASICASIFPISLRSWSNSFILVGAVAQLHRALKSLPLKSERFAKRRALDLFGMALAGGLKPFQS